MITGEEAIALLVASYINTTSQTINCVGATLTATLSVSWRLDSHGTYHTDASSLSRTFRSSAAAVNGLSRKDILASNTPCRTIVSLV